MWAKFKIFPVYNNVKKSEIYVIFSISYWGSTDRNTNGRVTQGLDENKDKVSPKDRHNLQPQPPQHLTDYALKK